MPDTLTYVSISSSDQNTQKTVQVYAAQVFKIKHFNDFKVDKIDGNVFDE